MEREPSKEQGKFYTVDVFDKEGNLHARIFGDAEATLDMPRPGRENDPIGEKFRFSSQEEAEAMLSGSAALNYKDGGYGVNIVEHTT